MLFLPDHISLVCRKKWQFFIVGLGFFIWEKNLSELVRRIPLDLLGFPEIPRFTNCETISVRCVTTNEICAGVLKT